MKQEIIDLATRALSNKMPMLLLRGDDVHARAEGDIDFFVPSRQAVKACLLLANAAREMGWYLIAFRNIGYLAQMLLVKPSHGREDEAIKVDFFAGFEWYGVGSDIVSRRFFKIVYDSSCATSKNELVATVNFVQKCLIAGQLSKRDWARVISSDGISAALLLERVQSLGMPLTAHDIEKKGVFGFHQWKFRAASAGICGLIGLVHWFPRVALAHLCFNLGIGTNAGHLIGLSGLDGSGKSTQMERLFAVYRKAGSPQPRLVHLLPEWIPLPHKLLGRKKTVQNYTRPYAEAPVRSRLSGLLRIGYYLVAFCLAKFSFRVAAIRGQVVVLDRSFADFVADLTRARIPDFCLPNWLTRLCAPKGTFLFLDASPETVVRRKGELQLEKATDLRQRYLNIFRQVDGVVIDAEGTPDVVFSLVLEQVDAVYRARLSSMVSE
jgi:thymidylate kinase